MNRRETLIATLRGDVAWFRELPELLKQNGIFNEDGLLDTELLIEVTAFATAQETAINNLLAVLSELLGCDTEHVSKKPKEKDGEVWTVQKILAECTLEDNIMRLPQVQFASKTYLEVKNRNFYSDYIVTHNEKISADTPVRWRFDSSSDILFVDNISASKQNLTLYNMQGLIVESRLLPEGKSEISFRGLAHGVYILRIGDRIVKVKH